MSNKTHIWIVRVPTDDNGADLPSREEYSLVKSFGAVWVEPVVAVLYSNPAAVGIVGK